MNRNRHPRRSFLQIGVTGFCAALFGSLPKISFAKSYSGSEKGIVVRENEGIHIITGRRKVPDFRWDATQIED